MAYSESQGGASTVRKGSAGPVQERRDVLWNMTHGRRPGFWPGRN